MTNCITWFLCFSLGSSPARSCSTRAFQSGLLCHKDLLPFTCLVGFASFPSLLVLALLLQVACGHVALVPFCMLHFLTSSSWVSSRTPHVATASIFRQSLVCQFGSFVPRVFPCVQHLRLCTGAGFVAVSFEIAFPWLYLPLAVILCWFLGSCWLGSLPCLGGHCLPEYCVDLA